MNATTAATRPQTAPATDLRKCQTCGRIGREGLEVCTAWRWLGGVGDVLRTYCRDVPSCFARRERQQIVHHVGVLRCECVACQDQAQ